jgi:glycosyltransferase involved in cell wall biosynthesis
MSQLPLVSVICLCYNHEQFIREALDSVLQQTYANVEIIIVDDMSTDNSVNVISEYLLKYPHIKFISTGVNIGSCAAFNLGWRASKGAFIIDFATDDILLPSRISKQIEAFSKLDNIYGVVYSDAEYISDNGDHLYYHSQKYKPAPSGYVFPDVLGRYFICPPTMLIKREVFEYLNGYDETLAYEDFDFWIRSAKQFKYHYLNSLTTKRRIHNKSMSRGLYQKENKLLASTVKVCQKAASLVQTRKEEEAMGQRIRYEARQAYLHGHPEEAAMFLDLYPSNLAMPSLYKFMYRLSKSKIELGFLSRLYQLYKSL